MLLVITLIRGFRGCQLEPLYGNPGPSSSPFRGLDGPPSSRERRAWQESGPDPLPNLPSPAALPFSAFPLQLHCKISSEKKRFHVNKCGHTPEGLLPSHFMAAEGVAASCSRPVQEHSNPALQTSSL